MTEIAHGLLIHEHMASGPSGMLMRRNLGPRPAKPHSGYLGW